MKTFQIATAAIAVAVAGTGIWANKSHDEEVTYYTSLWRGPRCDFQQNLVTCDEGDGNQCTVLSGLNTMYVSKKIDDGPCTVVFRQF